MRFLDRWRYGHTVAFFIAAALTIFCACVHVARGEAFPAAVAGFVAGDLLIRGRLARREALKR
jgi:hypothetical protein